MIPDYAAPDGAENFAWFGFYKEAAPTALGFNIPGGRLPLRFQPPDRPAAGPTGARRIGRAVR